MAAIPEFLECPLCFEVFTQVVESPCCHRCFCLLCIKNWLKKNQTCPNCRNSLTNVESCVPNIPFQRLVDELPATCDNASQGCKDKLTRGIHQEHMKKCGYVIIKCQYGESNCKEIYRKDFGTHKEECLYRPVQCTQCSTTLPFNQLEKHLDLECPNGPIKCTQEGCTATGITKSTLKLHLDQSCLFSLIFCPFHKYGICKESILRGQLEEHYKENSLSHITATLKLLEKRDVENSKFLNRVDELQKIQFDLELGIEQLSDLKPKLNFHPLSVKTIPVVLPSYLTMDDPFKKLAYIHGDQLNIASVKSNKSFLSFNDKSIENINVIITGDRPVPTLTRFTTLPYYFEITVRSKEDPGVLFGFIDDSNGNNKGVLGKIPQSYALEVYSQRLFGPSVSSKAFCGVRSTSGTYGCGWDQKEGVVFFVVDENCGGTAFRNVKGNLKPAICFTNSGAEVFVNFGVSRFLWDSKKYWEPFRKIEREFHQCLDTGKCTYNATGTDYFPQLMFHCKDCSLEDHYGMCEACTKICHKGHTISAPIASPAFFCDCGHLQSLKKKNICKCL